MTLWLLPSGSISGVFYLLLFDGRSRRYHGPGEAGSVIIKIHIPSHAAWIMCVASMAHISVHTTNNVTEYRGLVNGLCQAKASTYSPLHVIEDCAQVLSQLWTHRSPHKPHMALLFWKTRADANDIVVFTWRHHYRDYNYMTDQLANIAMSTWTLGSPWCHWKCGFLDNDVNHWLEISHPEHPELQSHATTARGLFILRQHLAQLRSTVQVLDSPYYIS